LTKAAYGDHVVLLQKYLNCYMTTFGEGNRQTRMCEQ